MTLKPEEIEARSFEIIDEETGDHRFSPEEWSVVRRAIHATADLELKDLVRLHPDALRKGVEALRTGADIVVDVEMVRAGINKNSLHQLGGQVHCFIGEATVAERAKRNGTTRSAESMRWGADRLAGSIVAIGNAPTALLELCKMIEEGVKPPALVIGVPVGFVSAAESKELLTTTPVPYIVVSGRKGGSTVAVAIVNALLKLALMGGK